MGFAIASILVVAVFITSKSYTQLAVATALYPLLAYYAFRVFPIAVNTGEMISTDHPIKTPLHVTTSGNNNPSVQDGTVVVDIERRTLLKIIGGAGVSMFLFSILGNRFGNMLLSGDTGQLATNNSQPSQPGQSTFDGYNISEIDEGVVTYYGFTNTSGGWLIMKEDVDASSFRYVKGDSDFPGNWNKRQRLNYDYYHNLF